MRWTVMNPCKIQELAMHDPVDFKFCVFCFPFSFVMAWKETSYVPRSFLKFPSRQCQWQIHSEHFAVLTQAAISVTNTGILHHELLS